MIKAKQFKVFNHYKDELNVNYSKKFDVGMILLD